MGKAIFILVLIIIGLCGLIGLLIWWIISLIKQKKQLKNNIEIIKKTGNKLHNIQERKNDKKNNTNINDLIGNLNTDN